VDVTLDVQDALDRYGLTWDDSDVAVDTNGNTVTLTGHVRTWAEHDAWSTRRGWPRASTTSPTTCTSLADEPEQRKAGPGVPSCAGAGRDRNR
jgi:hypothetical protein